MEEGGHAGQHMSSPEHSLAMVHKLRDRMFAIPDALLELRCNKGYGLSLVELQTARKALLSKEPCLARRVLV